MKGDINLNLKINKKIGLSLLALTCVFALADYVSIVDVESSGGVSLITPEESAPVGTVAMWTTSTPPTGWLEMNGQSTSGYSELASIVGSTVPDMRGYFVRGWDNGANVDTTSSRSLLSYQDDAIRNITGNFGNIIYQSNVGGGSGDGAFSSKNGTFGATFILTSATNSGENNDGIGFDASNVVPTANENMPKNIALMYIIRAE